MHQYFKPLTAIDWLILVALVVLTMFGAIGAANAADRADEVKAYPPEAYCRHIGGLYYYGVKRHNDGAPAVFKHWNKEDPSPVADDAFYVRDWDNMTTNEQTFAAEHVMAGWLFAENLTAAGKAAGHPKATVASDAAAVAYYKACLEKRAYDYGTGKKT